MFKKNNKVSTNGYPLSLFIFSKTMLKMLAYDCLHTGYSPIRVCRLASHSLVVVVEVVAITDTQTDRRRDWPCNFRDI